MKKLIAVAAFVFAALIASHVNSDVIDAPHNDTFGIKCATCHSYSLWWKYSPSSFSDTPNPTEINSGVCDTCHDGSKPQYPTMKGHSSFELGTKYGTWDAPCMDCHDPHYQGQLFWSKTNTNELFLVDGVIQSAATDTPTIGETTITYSSYTVNDAQWDIPNSLDSQILTWENKNIASPTRGLVFVHDTTYTINTYQITSVDSDTNTIVIKGKLPSEAIAPTAKPTTTTFGLIYGQLIKSEIIPPNNIPQNVQFFNPNQIYDDGVAGGYVTDITHNRTGLCQACHTDTLYWNNDVTGDTHNTDTICTTCHPVAAGFKTDINTTDHSAAGVAVVLDSPECIGCHQADDPITVHHGICVYCHESIATIPALALPASRNYVTAITKGNCKICHTTYSDFLSHNHDHTPTVLASQDQSSNTANCQGCHTAPVAPFIGLGEAHDVIPAGETSPCANCHNINDASLIGSATNFTLPSTECNGCHMNYFNVHEHGTTASGTPHWLSYDPATDISSGEGCGVRCHAGQVDDWDAIRDRHIDAGICGTCHNSTRANGAQITVNPAYSSISNAISQAGSANGINLNCLDCHWDKDTEHIVDHSLYVSGGTTTCVTNCHNADFSTDATDPKIHDSCTICHAETVAPVTLTGIAIGHADEDAGFGNPNTCKTCHLTPIFYEHKNRDDHVGQVRSTTNNTCETCHETTGDLVTNIALHNGACGSCHDLGNDGILTAGANGWGTAENGSGDCASCHTAYTANFYSHITPNHNIFILSTAKCTGCHNEANRADGVHKQALCANCHTDITGVLLNSANGDASKGPGDCAFCHTERHADFWAHTSPVDHNPANITDTPSCTGCHDEADRAAEVHQTNLCDTCHNATTGEMLTKTDGDASGGAGDCASCHTARATDYKSHNAPSHAALSKTPGCTTSCHIEVDIILDIHNNNCDNCHTPTTGVLISNATGGAGDCVYCHNTVNTVDPHVAQHDKTAFDNTPTLPCANCHNANAAIEHVDRETVNGTITCYTCHDPNNALYQEKIYW